VNLESRENPIKGGKIGDEWVLLITVTPNRECSRLSGRRFCDAKLMKSILICHISLFQEGPMREIHRKHREFRVDQVLG
jgi:hypothetical protein